MQPTYIEKYYSRDENLLSKTEKTPTMRYDAYSRESTIYLPVK